MKLTRLTSPFLLSIFAAGLVVAACSADCGNLTVSSSLDKSDGISIHLLTANPDTETAQYTILIPGFESNLCDTHF